MPSDFPVLRGQLVELHLFDESCITSEYLGWLRDIEVVRFSRQRYRNNSAENCLLYLKGFDGTSNLFLTIRTNGTMVGTMTAYVSDQHSTVDIGLMIGARSYWGKGIGFDAWQTLMTYFIVERKIRKVTAGTLRANAGMVRIMEKSGMHLEAIKERQQLVDNAAQDELYYARFQEIP